MKSNKYVHAAMVYWLGVVAGVNAWQVEVQPWPERYTEALSFRAGPVRIDFIVRMAWTVSRMYYEDKEFGSQSGANGAVLQWLWQRPALRDEDVRWDPFLDRLVALAESEEPGVAAPLWEALPAEERERLRATPAGKRAQGADCPGILAALNQQILDPATIQEEHLTSVTNHPQRVYARRAFTALAEERARGPQANALEIALGQRRILEWCFPVALASIHETIGTGHGGEHVQSVTVTLGAETIPLVTGGAAVYAPGPLGEGESARLVKESVIGPFDHRAVFTFPPAGPTHFETHIFRANDQINEGRFDGYMYSFMHMLPPDFTEFAVLRPDQTLWRGTVTLGPAGRQDRLINEPWLALVAYSPEKQLGVVYSYPESYEGSNHLYARHGKDVKWRAMLLPRTGWEVGREEVYHLAVTPFEAPLTDWTETGLRLAAATEWPHHPE